MGGSGGRRGGEAGKGTLSKKVTGDIVNNSERERCIDLDILALIDAAVAARFAGGEGDKR